MSPFPSKLWPFTAGALVVLFGAFAFLAAHERAPQAPTLGLFLILIVFSAHLPVPVSGNVYLSPGLMVCMAAIVVFADEKCIVGAVLVCSLQHVHKSDFTKRALGWVPFNVAVSGLACLACALTYEAVPVAHVSVVPFAVLAVLPAAAVYVVVAWFLLLLSYVAEGVRAWRDVLAELLPYGAQVMPFAVLGFLLGRLYLALGAAVLLLIIVPILIAREMFSSYMRVKESHEETVGMLIRALEAKDRYTAGHAERVANYARYIGEELNFMPARLERLRFAALMHDIGKLVVPNQLLNKPGRLTPEEFAKVRIHEKVSVQMLSHIDFLQPIAGAAHSDNTKFDPDNEDHPIEPYIVMIADAYDAMTSTRSYRKALPQDVAFQELRDKAGIQFHPECVEALIHSLEARGERHGAGFEEQDEFDDAPDAGLGSAGLGDLLPSES